MRLNFRIHGPKGAETGRWLTCHLQDVAGSKFVRLDSKPPTALRSSLTPVSSAHAVAWLHAEEHGTCVARMHRKIGL